jgi:hypothetical protein
MLNERRSHIVPAHKKLLSKLRGEVSQSVAQFVMRVKGKRSRSLDERVGDLSSNESRSFRDWRFWGLILWNSLSGEFISTEGGHWDGNNL